MKVNEIKQLAEIMQTYQLTKIEMSDEKTNLCIERNTAVVTAEPAMIPSALNQQPPVELQTNSGDDKLIKSPMVGIFYESEAPGSNPFVSVGTKFSRGDVLCIIEAMKMMNEIVAEQDGEIAEILASNGSLIEYNQPIFRLK